MANLTENQKSFVRMMGDSSDAEADGFSILAERQNAHIFFDELLNAGFFMPAKNPGPTPAKDPRYVHIPYWRGLDYLEAVARYASSESDIDLAKKIVAEIIAITRGASKEAGNAENYHTWRKFAEISALLPLAVITEELIDLVPTWLGSRYDRSTIGSSLGTGLVPKLLASEETRYHEFALAVVAGVTRVTWIDDKGGTDRPGPKMALDDFWVREVVSRNLDSLAHKLPRETAKLFTTRVAEAFRRGAHVKASWLYRPAVEEHAQNHKWRAAENIAVSGLRDALLVWAELDPGAVRKYVSDLNGRSAEMLRRVAVYVLNICFDQLREALPKFLDKRLFASGLTHESYGLLQDRFSEFGQADREAVFDLIVALSPRPGVEDPEQATLRRRRTWLLAINGKGLVKADDEYQRILERIGPPGPHPDFLSYTTMHSGPGPSGYSKAELTNFLLEGTLVGKLNEFEPGDSWDGPTVEGLVDELQQAILDRPGEFLEIRHDLLLAPRAYQYSFLNAYSKLWSSPSPEPPTFDWDRGWPALLDWMAALIGAAAFWAEAPDARAERSLEPTRDWIPSLVADVVRAGTAKDERAFAPELLPSARTLIESLLEHVPSEEVSDNSDPMTWAINTRRGRAIEALVNCALRSARVADKTGKGHVEVWTMDLQPLFDREVARISDGNPEFVILFGHYAPQFQYLSAGWTEATFPRVFDKEAPHSFALAVSGLAYANATRPLYQLLSQTSSVDTALAMADVRREAREALIQRMMLACLWNDEPFDGPRISALFSPDRFDDLEVAASYFWGLSNQDLSKDQSRIVLSFWRKAVKSAQAGGTPSASLMGYLARMVCFLEKPRPDDAKRITWIAEHANADQHSGWFFVKELERLVDRAPSVVAEALLIFVKCFGSSYDFEDHILNTTKSLANLDQRETAIRIAEHLSGMPQFRDLYREIR